EAKRLPLQAHGIFEAIATRECNNYVAITLDQIPLPIVQRGHRQVSQHSIERPDNSLLTGLRNVTPELRSNEDAIEFLRQRQRIGSRILQHLSEFEDLPVDLRFADLVFKCLLNVRRDEDDVVHLPTDDGVERNCVKLAKSVFQGLRLSERGDIFATTGSPFELGLKLI